MIDDLGSVTSCIGNAYETINLIVSTVNSLSASSIGWDSTLTTVNSNSGAWFNNHFLIVERAEYGETLTYPGLSSFTPISTRLYTRQLNSLREHNSQLNDRVSLNATDHIITLSGGKYLIEATAPHRDAGLSKLLFANIDTTGDHIVGAQSNSYIQSDQFTQGFSTATLVGYISVEPSTSKNFKLFHYISNKTIYTNLAQPVEAAVSYATDAGQAYLEEVYATVKITVVG